MIGGIGVIGVTSATLISALNDQIHRAGAIAEAQREAREAAGLVPPSPQLHFGRGTRRTDATSADSADDAGSADPPSV